MRALTTKVSDVETFVGTNDTDMNNLRLEMRTKANTTKVEQMEM